MANVQIAEQTKIEIALAVLKIDETGKSKKEIAEEYNVSARSVSRYAEKYEEAAMDLLNGSEAEELEAAFEEEKVEETEQQAESTEEAVEPEPETEKAETKQQEVEEIKPGKRGGKPRNGRWDLLNAIFAEDVLDSKSAELYKIVTERSVEQGLEPLAKGSFYAMVSIARKSAKKEEEK
jgi:predicted transcriptional regulator